MTPTVLLAGLAGVLAAVGLADLATAAADRRAALPPAGIPSRLARSAAALMRLGRRIGPPAPPGGLPARLAAAGAGPGVRPADIMAAKAGGALVAALVALPVVAALPLRPGLMLLVAAAAGGFVSPDLWLRRRARRRAERAELELADVLDLLRVAVEAGLPVGRALHEVALRRRGLLAAELRRVTARLELGVARTAALDELRRRLPLPAVAALVVAFERADRHGAPLAPALAALAQEARAGRARRLHERAAAAAPRIQLAIALLLVPAVLLMVAAALVHGVA